MRRSTIDKQLPFPTVDNNKVKGKLIMRETVYIVEDDLDIGELAKYLLTGLGKEAHVLRTISAFHAQMDIQKPQLIVLDIRLPDGNGMTLCNQLKNNSATKHIPIVIMSAHDNRPQDSMSIADGILHKPFRISDFEACMLKHLTA